MREPRYGGGFAAGDADTLPFVLPGELVEIWRGDTGKEGREATRLLEHSSARVAPGCVHFGVCGGCHYQHAEYAAQVEIKREILQGIFARAGLVDAPETGTCVGGAWGYRNRIRLRVECVEGTYRVGYSRPGSNEFLPIRMCPIAAPLLWRAAEALLALAEEAASRRWLGSAAEVEFFCAPDESRLQMQLFLRETDAGLRQAGEFAEFCERMLGAVPELAGAGALLDPELTRQVRRAWAGAGWGAGGLSCAAAGRSYWVPRGAFFQVNRFLVDGLVERVCAGQAGALAWDLFAGVGLFSRPLAERFGQVVAVEGGEVAGAALEGASRAGKGQGGFTAVRSSTLDFLRARQNQRERPELIVCDPPRAGLGAQTAQMLTRIAAPRVVYVSCDPVTLARDLAMMTRGGYCVESVELFDLFPQTFHMETVVHLRRIQPEECRTK